MSSTASNLAKTTRVFSVAILGLNDLACESFNRIFTASRTRTRSRHYKLVNIQSTDSININNYDIFIINLHNADARSWQIKQGRNFKYIPLVKSSQKSINNPYTLDAPLNPSRILKTLDRYTITELNYLPEFEIGHDSGVQKSTLDHLRLLKPDSRDGNHSCRVLIVDDSLAVRRQLSFEFNLINAKTHIVSSGEDAIKESLEHKFDLIFLDVVMPGMGGYNACKKIKRCKINRKTPVVLLTSKDSPIDKLKGSLAGCSEYLTKPISHNDFVTIVDKFVDRSVKIN